MSTWVRIARQTERIEIDLQDKLSLVQDFDKPFWALWQSSKCILKSKPGEGSSLENAIWDNRTLGKFLIKLDCGKL